MTYFYVYILQSLGPTERFYIGLTEDLPARLKKHNAGEVSPSSKHFAALELIGQEAGFYPLTMACA